MQVNHHKKSTRPARYLWQAPWSFLEAIFLLIALLFVGFALEWTTNGQGIDIPHAPINIYLGITILSLITLLRSAFGKKYIVEFLSSTQNSIAIISIYLVLVILMGSITQIDARNPEWMRRLGLSHITSSWPFVLINLYFLLVLGLVTARRLYPLTLRNVAFFINHCGLWIVVFAGGMGTGDLQRLQMELNTFDKQPTWQAINADKTPIEVPFAAHLLQFTLEEYRPKITLIDNITGIVFQGQGKDILLLEEGLIGHIDKWNVQLLEYLPEAGDIGGKFYRVNEIGAPPAAYIALFDPTTNQRDTAWVSCGSFSHLPVSHKLNDKYSLVMTVPEPKRYESSVVFYTPQGSVDTVRIEVNKAHVVNGYKVYQLDFDKRYGRWAETSILEVVYDPWQPVVYTGIFMLLVGGLYLLYVGQRTNTFKTDELA